MSTLMMYWDLDNRNAHLSPVWIEYDSPPAHPPTLLTLIIQHNLWLYTLFLVLDLIMHVSSYLAHMSLGGVTISMLNLRGGKGLPSLIPAIFSSLICLTLNHN